MFCDDLRQEAGNKLSLMGLYGTDLFIGGAKPSILPTFVVVVFIVTDVDDRPSQIRIRVIAPDKTVILNTELPPGVLPSPRPDSVKATAMGLVKLAPFQVTDEGDLEVYVETETGSIRAGRLAIRFTDASSSTEPLLPPPQSSAAPQVKAKKPGPSRPSRRRASPKRKR
jgi:hypothetical protein